MTGLGKIWVKIHIDNTTSNNTGQCIWLIVCYLCGCQDVNRQSLEPSLVSVFTDTSVRRLEDSAYTHVFSAASGMTNTATHIGSYHVIAAGSYLAEDYTAVFAVALQNAGLLIIRLPPLGSRGNMCCDNNSIVNHAHNALVSHLFIHN